MESVAVAPPTGPGLQATLQASVAATTLTTADSGVLAQVPRCSGTGHQQVWIIVGGDLDGSAT